jgi:uncharacterized membrane protein (DUF4010 family)
MNLQPINTSGSIDVTPLLALCVALGIGLLIGAERERHKGSGPSRGAAGIRTFAVTSVVGAVASMVGGTALLSAAILVIGAFAFAAYRRSSDEDPGLTTEVSLVLNCLLGAMAVEAPLLAGGSGAALAMLLAARERIHHFVRGVLSERELHDALLFAAAALILLPIAPDRPMGPFLAINPHAVASLIVLVMAASAIGYIATRIAGPRYGLAFAGLAGGFISSTATIHAMGVRAAQSPALGDAATAGAVLSSVATFIQLGLVVMLIQPSLLQSLAAPLAAGGAAAALYGVVLILSRSRKLASGTIDATSVGAEANSGRAFDLKDALLFAALVTTVLVVSAALQDWLGDRGAFVASAVAGFADPHATAASIASMAAAGKIGASPAVWLILAGLTSNSVAKAVVAFQAGGIAFARVLLPGLVLTLTAAWAAAWLQS